MQTRLTCLASALALAAGTGHADTQKVFNRIASFPTVANMAEGEDTARVSSAEIIAASADGMTLVYTDSPLGVLGRVDITDPEAPRPLGNVALDGEPTAVSIAGGTALVAVNTSESYTAPSGHLAAIDIASGEELARCDLGGQPDSTALAPDGGFLAVAIENERDEEAGDGRVPQMPAGTLVMVDLAEGTPDCASLRRADLTGLAGIAAEDPEPEFTDVNGQGEVAVTLQENNHLAIVGRDGTVLSHFAAGAVDLEGIDVVDERAAIVFDGTQEGRLREPDAVQWLGDTHLVTANEGDMDGGARGFTVFDREGQVVFESGASFEHAVAAIGHYPDRRSDAKGVEPEGMEIATFDGTPMMFLLSERASVVGVYDMSDPAAPVLRQLLPAGISPEGAVAIPGRNLLAVANETDLVEDGGVRAHVMLYALGDGPADYPTLTSSGSDPLIGWGAISGMVGGEDGILHAVNDSFYGYQPRIFTIDTTETPARITGALDVTRAGMPAQKLDMEGITHDGAGGFWVASEGRTDRLVPHALYRIDAEGEIVEEVALPASLLAHETRYGFEGITRIGDVLWMAVQREWADDPENMVKLLAYDTATSTWGGVHYEKAAPETGWVGLSEIVAQGDWVYVVERDNQIGAAAVTKKVYRIPASEMQAAPLDGALPVVSKEEVRDLVPDLAAWNGYIVDKVEGLAFTGDGRMWVSTDNDGVDDSSGETFLWSVALD
ncbi:esterase-like activity of phytase family protein [Roseivivax isoporae]|uniref:Alkaline phosphatase n=1 Tax=Roseivivax isoporae LMG 25204 TaxID=1449351 RepID=X7F6R2_9RHOB|nr:esterase-like activity of phytase family protein [Roseivivax isoporae]ETX27769.1 alkaline phosphatase [Roseivivax isoporae LMG 25204]